MLYKASIESGIQRELYKAPTEKGLCKDPLERAFSVY